MTDSNRDKKADGDHLDKDDLDRAEKGTGRDVPLVANDEDAFVPDTELDNPNPAAKKAAKQNDPTAGDAADH